MPIQLAITQPDGTQPTYHVVSQIEMNPLVAQVFVSYQSWMDSDHFVKNKPSVASGSLDASQLLGQPSPAAEGNIGPHLIDIIEKYLLTTPTFAGGTQVS